MIPPWTKQLFISYRSSDAAKVDKIAKDLSLLKYDDGIPRYTTWQDKFNLPPASPNWWDAIVDAIFECNMFVFHLSKDSLQSEVCRAELSYAHRLNRAIIPVVLDGEFFLNPQSGRYDLLKEMWPFVPDWLGEQQFLFYIGADFYGKFQAAVEQFERNWPHEIIGMPRPMNPDNKSVHDTNHALYDAACDYAERLAFAEAEKHFDALVRRNDLDYADVAAQWLQLIHLYTELIEIDNRRSARFIFNNKWTAYQALFPKVFLDGIFDPKGFQGLAVDVLEQERERIAAEKAERERIAAEKAERERIAAEKAERERIAAEKAERERIAAEKAERERIAAKKAVVPAPTRPTSLSLLPAPFDWIKIPARARSPGYSIAKYPVTHAQFAKFIEAGGYKHQQWWTVAGWEQRQQAKWTEPRYWIDSTWNGAEQPVVGVSWFEAVAFCLWLSETTGEKIMLPTEDQWQYAAQGDDGRAYPWGPKWDASRCNNSVDSKGIGKTTTVRQYEGADGRPSGDSPFGVVDMAGNVREWCLTDYDTKTNDINSNITNRVLRGGSWYDYNADNFRCDYRNWSSPHDRGDFIGFRLSRFN